MLALRFKFEFTGVREPGAEIQLHEVFLFDHEHRLMTGANASNPGGLCPVTSSVTEHCAHPAGDAVDLDLGWLDPKHCQPTCCADQPEGACSASIPEDNWPENGGDWPDCGCGDACTCRKGSKWVDLNMATANASTLEISFGSPRRLGAYALVTANDNRRRDPTEWQLYAEAEAGGGWVLLDARSVTPPGMRYTAYDTVVPVSYTHLTLPTILLV